MASNCPSGTKHVVFSIYEALVYRLLTILILRTSCVFDSSNKASEATIVPSSEKLYFYTKKSLKILIQNPYIIRICSRIVGAYKRDILFPQIDIMKITHYKILILRMLVLVGIFERGGDPDKFNINDTNIK